MKTRFLLLSLGILCLGVLNTLRAADYILIVHSSVATEAVGKEELKNILLGNKTKWEGGQLIKLAIQAGGVAHEKLVPEITARSADQYEKYLKKQVFTGKGVMPEVAKSDAEMIAYVGKTPGAIGYVGAGTDISGVKALKVN